MTTHDPKSPKELLEAAKTEYRMRNLDAADRLSSKALRTAKNDYEIIINVFLLRADMARRSGKTREALSHGKKALREAKRHGHALLIADAMRRLGFIHFQLFEPEVAEDFAMGALKLSRENSSPQHEADALALLGHVAETRNEFNKALGLFQAAKQLAIESGHIVRQVSTSSDMGRIHAILGDFDTALRFLDESDRTAHEHDLPVNLVINMARRGDIHRAIGDLGKAEALYNDVVRRARELKMASEVSETIGSLGNLALEQKRYDEALEHLHEALESHTMLEYERHKLYDMLGIGLGLIGLRRYKEALDAFWTVIDGMNGRYQPYWSLLIQTLEHISQSHRYLDQLLGAQRSLNLATRLRDASLSGAFTSSQKELAKTQLLLEVPTELKSIRLEAREFFEENGLRVQLSSGKISIDDQEQLEGLSAPELAIFKYLLAHRAAPVPTLQLALTYDSDAGAQTIKTIAERVKYFVSHIRRLCDHRITIDGRRGTYCFK